MVCGVGAQASGGRGLNLGKWVWWGFNTTMKGLNLVGWDLNPIRWRFEMMCGAMWFEAELYDRFSPVSLKTLSSGCTTEHKLLSTSVPSLRALRSELL